MVTAEITEHVVKEFADIAARRAQKGQLALPSRTGQLLKTGNESGGPSVGAEGLEAIASLSADEISDLIKDEHPQTIAIILLHLKTPIASVGMAMIHKIVGTKAGIASVPGIPNAPLVIGIAISSMINHINVKAPAIIFKIPAAFVLFPLAIYYHPPVVYYYSI